MGIVEDSVFPPFPIFEGHYFLNDNRSLTSDGKIIMIMARLGSQVADKRNPRAAFIILVEYNRQKLL